jgi:hypothetical protein
MEKQKRVSKTRSSSLAASIKIPDCGARISVLPVAPAVPTGEITLPTPVATPHRD